MEAKAKKNGEHVSKGIAQPTGKPAAELLHLIGFRVGAEEFCLDISRVQEIIPVPRLTRVPNAPTFMAGVMNLRGKVVPVIALYKRFGFEPAAPNKNARVLVVEIQGAPLGFMVDSVSEVVRIPPKTVESLPGVGTVEKAYVLGLGKIDDRLLFLLDVDRLVNESDEITSGTAQA